MQISAASIQQEIPNLQTRLADYYLSEIEAAQDFLRGGTSSGVSISCLQLEVSFRISNFDAFYEYAEFLAAAEQWAIQFEAPPIQEGIPAALHQFSPQMTDLPFPLQLPHYLN